MWGTAALKLAYRGHNSVYQDDRNLANPSFHSEIQLVCLSLNVLFLEIVLLCSPGRLGTCYVVHVGLKDMTLLFRLLSMSTISS